MTTIQDEWKKYRDACYPKGTTAVQEHETHQAFFAGALVAISQMLVASELPEDHAVARMAELEREIQAELESHVATLRQRNLFS